MLAVFILVLPFLLIFAINYMRDLHERQGENVNYCDSKGQIFTYIIHKSIEEILNELETGCTYTDLKYRYDGALHQITLHEGMPNGCPEVTYALDFRELPEGTGMRVRQLTHLRTMVGAPGREYRRGGNRYAWLQNEFWHQKLGAEPLPYQPSAWE